MPIEARGRGPMMIGVRGLALDDADRARLRHPLVGGAILFARNYESPAQLAALTREIRALRDPALVVGVDHEGGRVQRFRAGFTVLPPMRSLGQRYADDRAGALAEARRIGGLIADELGAAGVDFSFTPVLDLDHGQSGVIGDRAFAREPLVVAAVAAALCEGLRAGGMASVGKHFPGHGFVPADSHEALPVDPRTYAEIERDDLVPFALLVRAGLDAVMPAPMLYAQVDSRPAGFSPLWIQQVLRARLGFEGMVFSDDLDMAGAHVAGDIVARANASVRAGCDVVLACNDFAGIDALLGGWQPPPCAFSPRLQQRWRRMERKAPVDEPADRLLAGSMTATTTHREDLTR